MPIASLADTHVAATCSSADVQTAIDASADGDLVTVPAGECTWSTHVDIADKTITLQGVGHGCTGANSASGHPPAGCTGTATNITVTDTIGIHATTSTKSFRITGFRFNFAVGGTAATLSINKTSGQLDTKSAVPWRVDHCYFNGTARQFSINGARNFGLADNNIFYGTDLTAYQIFLFWGRGEGEHEGAGDTATLSGTVAHSDAMALGSADALYVEDSEFFYDQWTGAQNIGDGTAGQRIVIRYNVVRGPMIENHGGMGGEILGRALPTGSQ